MYQYFKHPCILYTRASVYVCYIHVQVHAPTRVQTQKSTFTCRLPLATLLSVVCCPLSGCPLKSCWGPWSQPLTATNSGCQGGPRTLRSFPVTGLRASSALQKPVSHALGTAGPLGALRPLGTLGDFFSGCLSQSRDTPTRMSGKSGTRRHRGKLSTLKCLLNTTVVCAGLALFPRTVHP